MKLISWNVNGLRACVNKGFLDFVDQVDADMICLQETKLQEGQIDLPLHGYHQFWNYAEKRATPARPSSPKRSPSLWCWALARISTGMRAG